MRAYSVREAAAATRATIELRLDDGIFHVHIDDGEVTIRSGPAEDPSLTVEAGNLTLLALLRRFAPAEELVEQGLLRLEGDEELLDVLTEVVRLPGAAESEAGAI
jgi:hypothetical protein